MSTITLDQVREAQRNAPTSIETKDLQRQYERQQNEIKAAERAAKSLAAEAAAKTEGKRLKNLILRPRTLIEGVRLVVMSRQQAEWAGNAPAVAGGWVAVNLPRAEDGLYALVAETWNTCLYDVSITEVAQTWADECIDNDELSEALAKLNACTEGVVAQ